MPNCFDEPETDRFELFDLFFSRTDERGIIRSCNETFVRVSGYSKEELIGAPHKLVRHPSMPKAVFGLLWSAIQQGQPLGAYVCNRTKNGRLYWVLAVVLPVEGGYLSVRLKSTSDVQPQVVSLYRALHAAEEDGTRDVSQSVEALKEGIVALGYNHYADFMTQSLCRELQSRNDKLGRALLRGLGGLITLNLNIRAIEVDAENVRQLFKETVQIPYNMRLEAARLEGADGPISVISSNHQQMSTDLSLAVERFHKSAGLGGDQMRNATFVFSAAMLMAEVVKGLEPEAKDFELLRELQIDFAGQTEEAVRDVTARASAFSSQCKDMRRMLTGLELTRIMCKIERAKFTGATEGLDEIVRRLLISERKLSAVMTKIEDSVQGILQAATLLHRAEQNAA